MTKEFNAVNDAAKNASNTADNDATMQALAEYAKAEEAKAEYAKAEAEKAATTSGELMSPKTVAHLKDVFVGMMQEDTLDAKTMAKLFPPGMPVLYIGVFYWVFVPVKWFTDVAGRIVAHSSMVDWLALSGTFQEMSENGSIRAGSHTFMKNMIITIGEDKALSSWQHPLPIGPDGQAI